MLDGGTQCKVNQALDDQEATRPVRITMADVLQEIIADAGVAIGVILNKGRGRKGSRLRAEVAYAQANPGVLGSNLYRAGGWGQTLISCCLSKPLDILQKLACDFCSGY